MTKCAFCPELGVATTVSTTSTEAFPFLCTQLGVNASPSSKGSSVGGRNGGGGGGAYALCSSCHSIWEEVSVLYTNMQGLFNLMARRVTQFKKNMHKGHGHKEEGGGRRGRKRTLPQPDDESLLSWWYPSSKKGSQVGVDVEIIETEAFRVGHKTNSKTRNDELELGEFVEYDQGGEGQEMDFDEYEITPQDSDEDEDEGQYEDDTPRDPSYDTLQPVKKCTPSKDEHETATKKKRRRPIGKGTNCHSVRRVGQIPRTATNVEELPYILTGIYFKVTTLDSNTGKVVATCLECKKHGKIKSISGNIRGTTNFLTHLKRCHTVMHCEYEESRKDRHRLSKTNSSKKPSFSLEMPLLSASREDWS